MMRSMKRLRHERGKPNNRRAEIKVAEPVSEDQRMIEVPLSRMRGFGLKPACPASPDCFLRKAAVSLSKGDRTTAFNQIANYYSTWRPETAAEVLGLPNDHAIGGYPPLAAIFPWSRMSPGEYLVALETGIRGYFLQNNKADWGVTDGHTQFGPVSGRKLRAQTKRVAVLVSQMDTTDFLDKCSPILGGLLENDETGDWAFDIRDGLHRTAVFSASGVTSITAQTVPGVSPTIRRSDCSVWAQVLSGLFTEGEALAIFDTYLGGTL